MFKPSLAVAFSLASVLAAQEGGSYIYYTYDSTDTSCENPTYASAQVVGVCKYYGYGDSSSNMLMSCTDYGDHVRMIEHSFGSVTNCTGDDFAVWRYNRTKDSCATEQHTYECSAVADAPKLADFDWATTVISHYQNADTCEGPVAEFDVSTIAMCDLLDIYNKCRDEDFNDDDSDDMDSHAMVFIESSNQPCASLSVSFCFQSDSVITYRGKQYTMEELKAGKEPECKVPHTPQSRGVVIETSCNKTVRVTDTHLIATSTGFQTAISLKEGDVLFGSMEDDVKCTVLSNKKETSGQQYFGLNCLHSEVLVDGIRASTFGDFHTLPSWYMYYSGMVVGPDLASRVGAYVAEWYMALTN